MPSEREEVRALSDTPTESIARALRGDGLWLDIGMLTTRVQSQVDCAAHLQSAYRNFPFMRHGAWADLHVRLDRPRNLRRWIRPQARFVSDGTVPFEPFPADTALPLMEWGSNWLIGRRMHDALLFHAGVLERDGLALLLPALPGSGKSTLTAALSLRGWRLLSDEFGAYDPDEQVFRPVLKPVALKNHSIQVIREFEPGAELGPAFPKTRKGTVAHLSPSRDAVRQRHDAARPGAIVLPKWQAGSATRLEPIRAETAFSSLAFNAFNYAVLGATGFRAAARLSELCPAWHLVYSDLDEAMSTLAAVWPGVVARHHRRHDLAASAAQPGGAP